MGLSHFLLLPLLHGDKTLGLGCGQWSSNRLRRVWPWESGAPGPPAFIRPCFPSFLSSVTFPSPLSLPPILSQSLCSFLCATLMHSGSLPACLRGKGAVLSLLHIHLLPRWMAGTPRPPAWALLPSACGLLLGLEPLGTQPAGRWGCAPLPVLGDRAGLGAPAIMKRKRLLMAPGSWKVRAGLGEVSAEAGGPLSCTGEAQVGRVQGSASCACMGPECRLWSALRGRPAPGRSLMEG